MPACRDSLLGSFVRSVLCNWVVINPTTRRCVHNYYTHEPGSCAASHNILQNPPQHRIFSCWTQGAIYQDYGKWLQSLSPAGEDDVDHPNDAQGQSWRCWECSSCPRLSSPTPLCYLTCAQSYLQLLSVLSYLCSILLVSSVNTTAVCVHLLSLPIS